MIRRNRIPGERRRCDARSDGSEAPCNSSEGHAQSRTIQRLSLERESVDGQEGQKSQAGRRRGGSAEGDAIGIEATRQQAELGKGTDEIGGDSCSRCDEAAIAVLIDGCRNGGCPGSRRISLTARVPIVQDLMSKMTAALMLTIVLDSRCWVHSHRLLDDDRNKCHALRR